MSHDDIEAGAPIKGGYISSDALNTIVSSYISRKSAEEIDFVHSQGGKVLIQSKVA